MDNGRKSICFVGVDNYPVLAGSTEAEYIGGESVQQTMLARAFVGLGYDVSMIVRDHGQPDRETIDGITVIKGIRDRGGIPILRFIHPRTTGLLAALKEADAETYFQSCASAATGIVAWHCRRHDRNFVFRLAHDSDCIPGKQLIRFWRDRKIYEFGVRNADLISAQGTRQVELLQENYGVASVPINMVVEVPQDGADVAKDADVLWVNNMRPFKRPDLALELAKKLPNLKFVMIGGPVAGHEALYDDIRASAETIDNLEFVGPVPYAKVNDYFQRARLFVNTSDQEGFPNSFLQAWIRGVPVVSFFDPDGLIAREALGDVPADLDQMAERVAYFLADRSALDPCAERCKRFAHDHYSADSVARVYESLVSELHRNH